MAEIPESGALAIAKKIAYLKGLMDGLDWDRNSDMGKMLVRVVDILEDISVSLTGIESDLTVVEDDTDNLDDRIQELNRFTKTLDTRIFGLSMGLNDPWDLAEDEEDDEDDDDRPVTFELTCPGCHKPITVDEDTLALGKIQCPKCGEIWDFDLAVVDDDEDDDSIDYDDDYDDDNDE